MKRARRNPDHEPAVTSQREVVVIIQKGNKPGDPSGRRLARDKANLLAEAERIARVLEIFLQRADYPSDTISQLIRDIAIQQRAELQRAHGRIEPRTRFKSPTGHPLLRQLPISHLYVDESGTPHVVKGSAPEYFALGAIAIGNDEANRYRERADTIKERFFGRTDFQFHEPFMRLRRITRGIDYWFAGDEAKQQEFDAAVRELIVGTDFVAFGAAVRKSAYLTDFVVPRLDPYLPTNVYSLAITLLLERYVDALANTKPEQMGRIHFESQGPREDAYHQLEYARILLEGTQWVSASAFQSRLETGIRFSPKSGSDPSELSDFFARELYEWVLSECQSPPQWWDAFCSKVYVRGTGQMGTFGIKIFPDSDIRDRIESHRIQYGAKKSP